MTKDAVLERVVAAVLSSTKYRNVDPGLVRAVAARELPKARSAREAERAVRNRLHQVVGACLDGAPRWDRWLGELRAAYATGDPGLAREACRAVMRRHASTRERLPILDRFYRETLGGLGPIRSVLDVACGLGPLARAWMPLAPDARYTACDVDAALVRFVGECLALAGVAGTATVLDLTRAVPTEPADIALVLKTLPTLERLEPTATLRLLDGLDAPHLLVSFPARSLGGREKGMVAGYEARFRALIAERRWRVERWEFPTELAFLVSR